MIPKELLKKIRHIEIRTTRLVNDLFGGEYLSVFKGQGIEFADVREYVPGDDIRTIDWNVTARSLHPFVKKFVEEREMTVFFIVDMSGSQYFGSDKKLKAEIAAEITALEADRGDYLGYVRLVGRRQGQTELEDQIVSVPTQYTKKPLLRSEEVRG